MLQPRGRGFQHRHRGGEPFGPFGGWADKRVSAQRDANRARCAERLGAADLVGGELAGLVVAAELCQRQGRRRPPREKGGVLSAERPILARAAAKLLDRGFVVARRGAKHA